MNQAFRLTVGLAIVSLSLLTFVGTASAECGEVSFLGSCECNTVIYCDEQDEVQYVNCADAGQACGIIEGDNLADCMDEPVLEDCEDPTPPGDEEGGEAGEAGEAGETGDEAGEAGEAGDEAGEAGEAGEASEEGGTNTGDGGGTTADDDDSGCASAGGGAGTAGLALIAAFALLGIRRREPSRV